MKKLLIFVPKGFELLELAPFTDVFGWAKEHGKADVSFETCAFDDVVSGAFGNRFTVDSVIGGNAGKIMISGVDFDQWIDGFDGLAIPGGFENYGFFDDAKDGRLHEIVRRFHDKGRRIGTVCISAFVLGEAGILSGRCATTYNQIGGRKQKQLSKYGCKIVNESVVIDGNLISSYGPATATEVAFIMLEDFAGRKVKEEVKLMMGYE